MPLIPNFREVLKLLLITFGHILLTKWALTLVTPQEHISLMWLPDGYLLGVFVLLPYRLWPSLFVMIFTAAFVTEVSSTDRPMGMILLFFLANALESIVGAILFNKLSNGRESFKTFAHLGYFLILCVIVIPSLSALIGAGTVVKYGFSQDFMGVYRTWLSSAGLGILFVAPAVLEVRRIVNDGIKDPNKNYRLLLFTIIVMFLIVIISSELRKHTEYSNTFLVYFSLPVLCWAAISFGLRGGLAVAAVLVITAVQLTAMGIGPFSGKFISPSEAVFHLQSYLGASIVASLFIAIAVDNLKGITNKLTEASTRFRMLFENSPISLWEEDFSELKKCIDNKQRLGMTDIPAWLRVSPEEVRRLAGMVKILNVNDRTLNMFKAGSYGELAENLEKLFNDEALSVFTEEIIALYSGKTSFRAESYQLRLNGEKFYTITGVSIVPGHEMDWARIVVSVEDIDEQKVNEKKLLEAAAVYESTSDGVVVLDKAENIININSAFTDITGYTREDAIGQSLDFLYSGNNHSHTYQVLRRSLQSTGRWQGEISNRRKDGNSLPVLLTINTVFDENGKRTGFAGVFSDITALKESQERLHYLAHYNPLTELPNRLLFNDRLHKAIKHAARIGKKLAIIFMDIDQFKHINDSLGHSAGDELLKKISGRLLNAIRSDDTLAHISGDEFVLIAEDIIYTNQVVVIVEKVLETFKKPFEISGTNIRISASLGISIFPNDGEDAKTLLSNADAAMYKAKEEGRNTFRFYTRELTESANEYVFLENSLHNAIAGDELFLVYQPKLNMRDKTITGLEALLRWRHPSHGIIPPSRFIPIAEQCGIIKEIGEWVLEQACLQGKQWLDGGIEFGRLAVNVSGRQLQNSNFQYVVQDVLDKTGLPHDKLELEVTESFVMNQNESTIASLEKLRKSGIKISIDDFGTGYSSLSYLKRLPIDNIKIDRSFVRDIPLDSDDMAIAEAIIVMGQALGMEVIAEGVENQQQVDFLLSHECTQAQGYLFQKPALPDELSEILLQGKL